MDTQTTLVDDWRNLLESSRNLTVPHASSRINRSLKGIEKEAQRLSSRASRHVPSNQLKDFAMQAGVDIKNQAQYISAMDGLSVPAASAMSVQQARPPTVQPLISGAVHASTSSMDLNNLLKYHHEQVISGTIQQCQLLNEQYFGSKYNERIDQEWNCTKMDILNYFGCNPHSQQTAWMVASGRNRETYTRNNTQLDVDADVDDNGNAADDVDHDVHIHDDSNRQHSLNVQLQEGFGQIIEKLAVYRNLSTPLTDFERNTQNAQMVQRSNICSPISSFCVLHREIYDECARAESTQSQNNVLWLQYLIDLWRALNMMIFENGINYQRQCQLKEKEYATFYANNNAGLQRLFVNGARCYLQKMYYEFIEKEVEKNKNFAKKGGKPGTRYVIKAFVRLQYQISNNFNVIPKEYETVLIDNEVFPLWPLIYYAYRCGDIDSCLYFASLHDSHHYGDSVDILIKSLQHIRQTQFEFQRQLNVQCGDMQQAIALYQQEGEAEAVALEQQGWRKELHQHFQQHLVKKSGDPFEILMYVLIGKIVIGRSQDFDQILNRQEDYLWFKLSTLYYAKQEIPAWMNHSNGDEHNVCTLSGLQNEVKQHIGPTHFENAVSFVTVLLLTQQFDDAVAYLSRHDTLQAVHLAICLRFYGLLRYEEENAMQLTLSYLRTAHHDEATLFYYLYVLDGVEHLAEYVCEPNKAVRQTLIGNVYRNRIDICSGLLYRYCGTQTLVHITQTAAHKAYENGEIEHCIVLYLLCGNFNVAAMICCKLLASHITDRSSNHHSKHLIVNLAKELFKTNQAYLENNAFHSLSEIDKSMIKTIQREQKMNLISCIHFAEFYDLYYKIRDEPQNTELIEQALNVIHVNNLIPISDENVIQLNEQRITMNDLRAHCVDKILALDEQIKRYFGDICVCILEILKIQFDQFRVSKQLKNIIAASTKCHIIYNLFNYLEAQIKPIGAGDTAKQISNLYYQTRTQ